MKTKSKIFYLYAALVIIYIATALFIPPAPGMLHKYHISLLTLRLLDIALDIPYALIWFAGFYAFVKLRNYSSSIKHSKDGKHVLTIAYGVLLLVLWPPLASTLGNIFSTTKPVILATL